MTLIEFIKKHELENADQFMLIIRKNENNCQFIRERIPNAEAIGCLEIGKKNLLDCIFSNDVKTK